MLDQFDSIEKNHSNLDKFSLNISRSTVLSTSNSTGITKGQTTI